ncbi:hypothetical protein LWI29_032037 [Acer saccharum]|uniref:Uncharacterized protein n=1 Tax=Acer saccharum TaxID=4024 RepID=A0AA39SQP6_ACESA|nr:hypothetical protein LWI29_032037 [Acer saccharum]
MYCWVQRSGLCCALDVKRQTSAAHQRRSPSGLSLVVRWSTSAAHQRTMENGLCAGGALDVQRKLTSAHRPIRIDSSTKKLDHLFGVGKSPSDKRGLGYEDGKKISTFNKTVFVKSLKNEETSIVQIPRKKLEVGQCSNAQVKMGPRRQSQAQPPRVPQANFPPQLAHKGKRPIMQPQAWKQPRPVQQRRWIEPTYP